MGDEVVRYVCMYGLMEYSGVRESWDQERIVEFTY